MRLLNLVLIIASLGLGSLSQADTPKSDADGAAGQKAASKKSETQPAPNYQVELLEASPTRDGVAQMGSMIRVGVFGGLRTAITERLATDAPSVRKGLKLYLNGFPMEGIVPEILQPEGFKSRKNPELKPVWVLQYQLARDASDDSNRKAWDTLLSQLKFGSNELQIGIGFNGSVPHLGAEKELRFEVAPLTRVVCVIVIGLLIFLLLM